MKETLELTGTIEKIIFRNSGNGYTVAAFRVEKRGDAEAEKETLTVVGTFGDCHEGRTYLLRGEITTHAKYGRQLQVSTYEEAMPEGSEAVEQFLAGGAIRGIGPKMAAAIVAKFGDDTLTVIETQPERLTEISGIGEKKAAAITESFRAQREFAAIAIELQRYGVNSHQAMQLYRAFGADTVQKVMDDPYCLAGEELNIGFRRADEIARKLPC